jgi:predicted nucleotidyltransferase
VIILNSINDKTIILDKLKSAEFLEFINKFDLSSIIVFGSLCTDDFNEASDVDIAILAEGKISLDSILDIELFLEKFLKRSIDVIDLKSDNLDLFIKINILNNGKVLFTKDNNRLLEQLFDETNRIYIENQDYMFFRRVDVLS